MRKFKREGEIKTVSEGTKIIYGNDLGNLPGKNFWKLDFYFWEIRFLFSCLFRATTEWWEVGGKFLEEKFLWKGKIVREGHDLNPK